MADTKPYRPNVGICLINPEGHVWMGRGQTSGPEVLEPGRDWEMPQGGLDGDEALVEAARRELWEETRVESAEFLALTEEWWRYDFPPGYTPTGHKLDAFAGQEQRWVAFRFTGQVGEIDISASHTGEPQEFFEWRWMSAAGALDCAPQFKARQYSRVFNSFSRFLA